MRYQEPVMEIIVLNTADIQTMLQSGGSVGQDDVPGVDWPQ